jgi:heterodisulfide reductase subunit C
MANIPLHLVVLNACGQDLRPCWTCSQCSTALDPDMDLTLESLIRMILLDDGEVLESRTLWSSRMLSRAQHLCPRGLDLEAVLLALREEGWRRGVVETII